MTDPPAWTHDALLSDLAGHMFAPNRMVWTDMQLGPAGSPRPDVYRLTKSFVRPEPTTYEVKVSRSDFLADVSAGKWANYLDYSEAVVFAAPAGMLKRTEIPPRCGLIQRHEKTWRLAKRPQRQPVEIPQKALLKLLIDGIARVQPAPGRYDEQRHNKGFSEKFGATAARLMEDIVDLDAHAERVTREREEILQAATRAATRERERIMAGASDKWDQLCDAVGLPAGSRLREVEMRIWAIRSSREEERPGLNAAAAVIQSELERIDRLPPAKERQP